MLDDVNALLEEEKPDSYPCSPLLSNSLYTVLYLNINNLLVSQSNKSLFACYFFLLYMNSAIAFG